MKLKFLGPKNFAKGSLIVEAHAFEKWLSGEIKELDSGKAFYLMQTYPGLFVEVKEEKSIAAPENKMVEAKELKTK